MRCEQARGGGRDPRRKDQTGSRIALAALSCLAFVLCLMALPAPAHAEEGLYGELSEDGTTLTYKYGEHDVVWSNSRVNAPVFEGWFPSVQQAGRITKVIIDDSAKEFRPVSLDGLFFCTDDATEESGFMYGYGRPNLKTIEGLEKIDVSSCSRMTGVFEGCSSLTSLDVSGWDTSSATDMSGMFEGCSSLTSLDLSGWDTSRVKSMDFMFTGCDSLETLKLGTGFKWNQSANLRSDVFWRSSADGKGYDSYKIPSNIAATYTAEYPTTQDAIDSPVHASGIIMHRLYNPYSGEHFYTASTKEKDHLASIGWSYEGRGWTAPRSSSTPVYRLYNPYAGDHHYTTSAEERDQLKAVGWNDEGVGWYSAKTDAEYVTVPLYRQYNPYATVGTHNYTTSKEENDMLVSVGWRAEGIGWYGLG